MRATLFVLSLSVVCGCSRTPVTTTRPGQSRGDNAAGTNVQVRSSPTPLDRVGQEPHNAVRNPVPKSVATKPDVVPAVDRPPYHISLRASRHIEEAAFYKMAQWEYHSQLRRPTPDDPRAVHSIHLFCDQLRGADQPRRLEVYLEHPRNGDAIPFLGHVYRFSGAEGNPSIHHALGYPADVTLTPTGFPLMFGTVTPLFYNPKRNDSGEAKVVAIEEVDGRNVAKVELRSPTTNYIKLPNGGEGAGIIAPVRVVTVGAGDVLESEFQSFRVIRVVPREDQPKLRKYTYKLPSGEDEVYYCLLAGWVEIDPNPLPKIPPAPPLPEVPVP